MKHKNQTDTHTHKTSRVTSIINLSNMTLKNNTFLFGIPYINNCIAERNLVLEYFGALLHHIFIVRKTGIDQSN